MSKLMKTNRKLTILTHRVKREEISLDIVSMNVILHTWNVTASTSACIVAEKVMGLSTYASMLIWNMIMICKLYSHNHYIPARSRQSDESFHMCHFQDDPLPLGSKVRSALPKSLYCMLIILILL